MNQMVNYEHAMVINNLHISVTVFHGFESLKTSITIENCEAIIDETVTGDVYVSVSGHGRVWCSDVNDAYQYIAIKMLDDRSLMTKNNITEFVHTQRVCAIREHAKYLRMLLNKELPIKQRLTNGV